MSLVVIAVNRITTDSTLDALVFVAEISPWMEKELASSISRRYFSMQYLYIDGARFLQYNNYV